MTTVTIPDFNFAVFYYAQILESLIQYKRQNVPELTDESPQEPLIQFLRAAALVGHLNNVHIDMVANESFLRTAKLVSSVRDHLRLINYALSPASPSQVDILYELSRVLTSDTLIVPENAWAATRRQGDEPIINFETLTAVTVGRTDQFDHVLSDEDGSFTDFTSEANNQVAGNEFTPWTSPDVKDALYFGHKDILWAVLAITIKTAAQNISGVWEYYDGDFRKTAPTSITDMGGYLRVDLTSYLGTQNRAGTQIRVQLNETTAYEDVESVWTGSANVVDTTGYLGQTTPSTDAADYTVGSDWEELNNLTDGTSDLTTTGDVTYDLPQSVTEDWIETSVDGKEAYWLRYRITAVSTPVSPDIDFARLDTDKQYVVALATQGRTKIDDPLGSSDGTADQRFETSQDHFIDGSSEVYVNDELWVEVDNFLGSQPTDKHYRIELGDDDRATVVFGDGQAGRIPPAGVNNIWAEYRYGAHDNGIVGPDTVQVDKTGLTNVNSLTNPRSSAGWSEAEGATEDSLERAKVAGPASLRILNVALGPGDVERLAVAFTDEDGARPFARARAIEEGFGPKTVEVVVVAAGGQQAAADQIDALELYLNGDRFSSPPVEKHLVQNQEATVVNFIAKVIDITVTVYGDVTAEAINNQLAAIVQPLAVKADGVTWVWEFGTSVPVSRLEHEIFNADQDITDVDITVPAADVMLQPTELPVLGTVNLTIVP